MIDTISLLKSGMTLDMLKIFFENVDENDPFSQGPEMEKYRKQFDEDEAIEEGIYNLGTCKECNLKKFSLTTGPDNKLHYKCIRCQTELIEKK